MIRSRIAATLLAGALAFSLAACGSSETAEETTETEHTFETETPSGSESGAPEEEESKLAPDGVWETDGERVTIEGDTVTIDYVDENGDVTETFWVGSFELNENSDTWTSTRDPDAEMTAQCETIDFAWEGTDNEYDTLSYVVTNEDGTKKTVRLERTESLGEVAEGVVPDFSGSEDETAAASSAKTSADTSSSAAADTSASAKTSAGDTAAASTGGSGSPAAEKTSSLGTNETLSNTASSENSASSSGTPAGNTGAASSGSGSSASSGSSGSSGTTSNICSHNYSGSVKTAATCSSAGTMKYTCTKCGDSYETSIPATGNHNWQAIYKTVHHDATGHYETVTVQEASGYTRLVCNRCGYYVDVNGISADEAITIMIIHTTDEGSSYRNESVRTPAVTEQQWVVDTAAYDEQVVDYYRCANCGATK